MTDPVVTTRSGPIRGVTIDEVHAFKGIRYAMPPVGELRFAPPRPIEPWQVVRDAVDYGHTAAQPPFPLPAEFDLQYPVNPGPDCLNLNIWTANPGPERLPVMVWFHGGGFEGGSSIGYDGSRFARDGVVFVSVNHRLGIDGFTDLGGGVANRGLLDQVAALEWVRDNIAAFGGDPANVTIFGESSGAMFVGMLLTMPMAHGLFRRAIMQSGAGNAVFEPATARYVGERLATALDVPFTPESFARTPLPRLFEALGTVVEALARRPDPRRWNGEPGARVTAFKPVVDGRILPRPPLSAIAGGAGADVDVLIGSNMEEGRLSLLPGGAIDRIDGATLEQAARCYEVPVADAVAAYRIAHPDARPGDMLALLQRDWWYRAPSHQLADSRTDATGRTYLYEFAWRSPVLDGRLGACHFLEVPFVFDLLDSPRFQQFTGLEAPQRLAEEMHAGWIAFAATGDPGWPRYEPSRRPVMRYDTTSTVVFDPNPAERILWTDHRW
ncbi:para-nitrobenzyl esterase [Stackebrandtia endophytica]|uniref:Carboxylic ester hydrolase n=1 Tax=Stackebrandtia endophytica TaxID=1496996 RepID=A0A543B3L8_9ACTN|nr:carboxylesterase family protein [Stackebrandtia endophytica]TQL79360.1 para-nitrobenzyl esterase [Stackebrandtia endophytica]